MRVEHIKCGAFANASEESAFRAVDRRLKLEPGDARAFIFTNLVHGAGRGRQPDEIDMIVIAPGGAVVIEVKHWDRSWLKGHGWDGDDNADLITLKAKRVATQLRSVQSNLSFVPAAMLLTKEPKSLSENGHQREIRGTRLYALSDIGNLLSTIIAPNSKTLDTERLARALAPRELAAATGEIRRVGRVGELRLLSPASDRFQKVFTGKDTFSGDRVTLYLYDLSASNASNAELVARREFESVQRLQKSPVLPSLVESFQPVPGYQGELFFFTLAESAAQTVHLAAKDINWSLSARIDFAISAMRALAELQVPTEPDGQTVVHRSLTPENVRVRADGQPLFAGWRWARLPRTSTIAEHAPKSDSVYSAPEVRQNGLSFADARSDVYSLCKVLSDLFSNGPEGNSAALEILASGLAEKPSERISAKLLTEKLTSLAKPTPAPVAYLGPQRWDEGHIIDWERGRYRIVSQLGEGGAGRTFKLEQLDGQSDEPIGTFVGKVIFNPDIGPAALNAYRKIRSIADHPGLSGVYQTADEWQPDTLFALLKWRRGEPIDSWRGDDLRIYAELTCEAEDADPETLLCNWAEQICGALDVLHAQGWVHGDVSPSNILIDNGQTTLIDFDLACPIGTIALTPGTVNYASPSRRASKPAQATDDLYALAASLFHVLTDRLPFLFDGIRRDDAGLAWKAGEQDVFASLAPFLDRAVHPDAQRRFDSARSALRFLQDTRLKKDPSAVPNFHIVHSSDVLRPNVVPRVKEILRAYPGSRYGNAETRGLDSDFAHGTYVETELDSLLPISIKENEVSLVVLCGNAGDGKTAFLQHLANGLGAAKLPSELRVWNETIGGQRIKINLDGAAAWNGKSADELLDDLFEPFHNGKPKAQVVHLVAVNDGRLMEWLESYERRNGETRLTEQLARALNRDGKDIDDHIRLIELNIRSLVGGLNEITGTISTQFVDRLVAKLVGGSQASEIWKPCRTCSARMRCSIRLSAEMMGASSDEDILNQGELLRHRLTTALQAVHQRNEVHITARELKAALSYILFGTVACEDLHANVSLPPHSPADFAFDPGSELRQGELLRELTRLDPGLEAHARIDRYLAGRGTPDPAHGAPRYADVSLKSARRKAFFSWNDDQISQVGGTVRSLGLNGGRRFADFRDFPLLPASDQKQICNSICQGLSRLEALPEIALSQVGIMPLRIVPRTPTESAFWIGKPIERFTLHAEKFGAAPGMETLHRYLILTYKMNDGRLEQLIISLELFALLTDLAEGVQILDAFSDDIFANLGVFTQRLAQEDERYLHGWNPADESKIYDIAIEQREIGQTIVLYASNTARSN